MGLAGVVVSKETAAAWQRLKVTSEGKLVIAHLEVLLRADQDMLLAVEDQHQARRVQGSARTLRTLIELAK